MAEYDRTLCGPWICGYPDPVNHKRGDRWQCPRCGTRYRLTRRVPPRPWRRWYATDGAWRLEWWWRR